MMYNLKDGDIVKILPLLKKEQKFGCRSFYPFLKLNGFYVGNRIIYDTPENHLRDVLFSKYCDYVSLNRVKLNKTALCIYHDGEVKFTLVGQKLSEIIIGGYNFDPRNNYLLKVSIIDKKTPIGNLKSFDCSEIIQQDWDKPNIYIDSQEEWIKWLENSQPFYIDDFILKNGVYENIDVLKKEGLSEYIYNIIRDSRELKINKVLNEE